METKQMRDGLSPSIRWEEDQTPVDWVRMNHKRGVSLVRLMGMAKTSLYYIEKGHGRTLHGFTSTQWHEVRHVVKALSVVTGEPMENSLVPF